MKLYVSREKTINSVQQEFRQAFPFLKLDFYKLYESDPQLPVKKYLPGTSTLGAAGLRIGGVIELRKDMQVSKLEELFFRDFGLNVQVSRKSGMLWLETTMTDKWTLEKQNEHGKEISLSPNEIPSFDSEDEAA